MCKHFDSFTDMCLTSHNRLRNLHINTPELTWDYGLAAAAQRWADRLAAMRRMTHDTTRGNNVGESIYKITKSGQVSCAEAVMFW